MANYELDPNDELDFQVDWTAWLDTGETITNSTWTVETGLTKMTTPPASVNGGKATVWLTGGTKGVTYRATNQITTSASRKASRTLLIDVTER